MLLVIERVGKQVMHHVFNRWRWCLFY